VVDINDSRLEGAQQLHEVRLLLLLMVCAGCGGRAGVADGVIGGKRQPQTAVESVNPR